MKSLKYILLLISLFCYLLPANAIWLSVDLETIIGSKVAGKGVPYVIHFYGSQTLTPILPWIK